MLPLIYSKQELNEVKSTRAGSVTLQQYLKPAQCKKLTKVFSFIVYLIFFLLLRYTSMFFRLSKLGFLSSKPKVSYSISHSPGA